jgi:hypothetical protein
MKDRKGNDVKVGDLVKVDADGFVLEEASVGRVHKLKDGEALVIAGDAMAFDADPDWMSWCKPTEFALVSEKGEA